MQTSCPSWTDMNVDKLLKFGKCINRQAAQAGHIM